MVKLTAAEKKAEKEKAAAEKKAADELKDRQKKLDEALKAKGVADPDNPNVKPFDPKKESLELTEKERKEVSGDIERNVGYGKHWQTMQELLNFIQTKAMFNPDASIFGTTYRKLIHYIKSLIKE